MKFKLKFKMDNAAFVDNGGADLAEVFDILRRVSDNILEGRIDGWVRDSNGNRVGEWSMK